MPLVAERKQCLNSSFPINAETPTHSAKNAEAASHHFDWIVQNSITLRESDSASTRENPSVFAKCSGISRNVPIFQKNHKLKKCLRFIKVDKF